MLLEPGKSVLTRYGTVSRRFQDFGAHFSQASSSDERYAEHRVLTYVEWLVRVDDIPKCLREEWSVPQREGPRDARLELLRASAMTD
jgi:hypothetical protein